MGELRYMISEAAKQVNVEAHVLRYWEEELDLTIDRTEMGHRYYTEDDIQLFRCIKELKNKGMLLRDLKPVIPDLIQKKLQVKMRGTQSGMPTSQVDTTRMQTEGRKQADTKVQMESQKQTGTKVQMEGQQRTDTQSQMEGQQRTDVQKKAEHQKQLQIHTESGDTASAEVAVTRPKVITDIQLGQVRSFISEVVTEVVEDNNKKLKKEITESVTEEVTKEMDYMLRAKEQREEEHFRKMDCLIRQQQAHRREVVKETPIGRLKKIVMGT